MTPSVQALVVLNSSLKYVLALTPATNRATRETARPARAGGRRVAVVVVVVVKWEEGERASGQWAHERHMGWKRKRAKGGQRGVRAGATRGGEERRRRTSPSFHVAWATCHRACE
jgi:hypothetical protein